MKKTALSWIPRIIGVAVILFLVTFSMDAFEGNEPIGLKLLGFLMHNIPALLLAGALIVAWKWEMVGGIIFIVFFLAGCYFFRSFAGNPASLAVTSPVLVAGILLVLSFARTRRREAPSAAIGNRDRDRE